MNLLTVNNATESFNINPFLETAIVVEENTPQLKPSKRTVGEVMDILAKYPRNTKIRGQEATFIYDLSTIQEYYSNGVLDSIVFFFWDDDD